MAEPQRPPQPEVTHQTFRGIRNGYRTGNFLAISSATAATFGLVEMSKQNWPGGGTRMGLALMLFGISVSSSVRAESQLDFVEEQMLGKDEPAEVGDIDTAPAVTPDESGQIFELERERPGLWRRIFGGKNN